MFGNRHTRPTWKCLTPSIKTKVDFKKSLLLYLSWYNVLDTWTNCVCCTCLKTISVKNWRRKNVPFCEPFCFANNTLFRLEIYSSNTDHTNNCQQIDVQKWENPKQIIYMHNKYIMLKLNKLWAVVKISCFLKKRTSSGIIYNFVE